MVCQWNYGCLKSPLKFKRDMCYFWRGNLLNKPILLFTVAAVNESCFFNEQCEAFYFQTHCLDGHCICRFDLIPTRSDDGNFECKCKLWGENWVFIVILFNLIAVKGERPKGPETYIDPAMIGVLVGMALMFVIICVVLRLFSQWVYHFYYIFTCLLWLYHSIPVTILYILSSIILTLDFIFYHFFGFGLWTVIYYL